MGSRKFLALCVAINSLFGNCHGAEGGTPKVHVPGLWGKQDGATFVGNFGSSAEGRFYASFTGIRYAQPPLGDLRFKPPVSLNVDLVASEINAQEEGAPCIQFDVWMAKTVIGDEDCLFLNVFSPATNLPAASRVSLKAHKAAKPDNEPLMPVMVYFHGGGFVYGSSSTSLYHPMYLMDRDIVLVTVNYRLHSLGFLSTEDSEYPGNMGLLDQNAALKWVKANIAHFGGNPELITIFGCSAGGASTNMHQLSPISQGLFQRVISKSGVANCPWALQPNALKNAQTLASLVECPTTDKASMMECLKTVPAKDLTEAFDTLVDWPFLPIIFAPRVDKEAEAPFLPDHPLNLMKAGKFRKVPWMTGVTRDEGLLFLYGAFLSEQRRKALEEEWDTFSHYLYLMDEAFEPEHHPEVQEKIRNHYLSHQQGSFGSMFEASLASGDVWFTSPAQDAIELIAGQTESYVYLLDYPSKSSWIRLFDVQHHHMRQNKDLYTKAWGTSHADDLPFLFKMEMTHLITEKDTPDDFAMKELHLDAFTTFARTGDPNGNSSSVVPWPKYQPHRKGSQIFVLNPVPKLTNQFIPGEAVNFWREMLSQFGNHLHKPVYSSISAKKEHGHVEL